MLDPKGDFEPKNWHSRLLSLVHYWLAIIEDPSHNPDPAREILADGFSLNLSNAVISDFEGFKAWLAGPASKVVASTHKISSFSQKSIGENRFTMSMTLDWNGILPNKEEMWGKTKHTWVVVDDPSERFARIETINVEIVEPFLTKS